MKVLKNPWKETFLELVSDSQSSIKIASPFVKYSICNEFLGLKKEKVSLDLITAFKLPSIYWGSLDLNALSAIISNNWVVTNFSSLHAKIYIFDDKKAVITSWNLTGWWMISNFEYWIYIDDLYLVHDIVDDFYGLWHHENAWEVKEKNILDVQNLLKSLKKQPKIKLPDYTISDIVQDEKIIFSSDDISMSWLKGWKKHVFVAVDKIQKNTFTLAEVLWFKDYFVSQYPDNQFIDDKVRQILQQLRDLGLIEFLWWWTYKKLWWFDSRDGEV